MFTGDFSEDRNRTEGNNIYNIVYNNLMSIDNMITENILLPVTGKFSFNGDFWGMQTGSLSFSGIVVIYCRGMVDDSIEDFKFSVEWKSEILSKGIDLPYTNDDIFTIDEMKSDVIRGICKVLKKAGYTSVGDLFYTFKRIDIPTADYYVPEGTLLRLISCSNYYLTFEFCGKEHMTFKIREKSCKYYIVDVTDCCSLIKSLYPQFNTSNFLQEIIRYHKAHIDYEDVKICCAGYIGLVVTVMLLGLMLGEYFFLELSAVSVSTVGIGLILLFWLIKSIHSVLLVNSGKRVDDILAISQNTVIEDMIEDLDLKFSMQDV